jgi:hypothetical protein
MKRLGLDNLAFDSRARLFVSSSQDGFIAEIAPDGKVRMVSGGGMILPGGVAVLPRGRGGESVFVADLFSLRELDARTGRQRSIERGFTGYSKLVSPVFTVAPDGDRLLLSSSFGDTVQLWDPAAHAPMATYDFAMPLNAIRFQGDLVVAELGSGSVIRARGCGEPRLHDFRRRFAVNTLIEAQRQAGTSPRPLGNSVRQRDEQRPGLRARARQGGRRDVRALPAQPGHQGVHAPPGREPLGEQHRDERVSEQAPADRLRRAGRRHRARHPARACPLIAAPAVRH